MDFFIGLMIGIFIGVLAGIFITVLMSANGRSEPEPDDGVDDVLDELFQTVQNQPKTVHTEEEKKDLDWKFRE